LTKWPGLSSLFYVIVEERGKSGVGKLPDMSTLTHTENLTT